MIACKPLENTTSSPVMLHEVVVEPLEKVYKPSKAKVHDLIHTKLEITPVWEKKQLEGVATLTLKPYFYSSDVLQLDAKEMLVHNVKMITDSTQTPLEFTLHQGVLRINLDKKYSRFEQYTIAVAYTARPEEVVLKGGAAITDAKGLFFINPDSTEANKPTQLWTQGQPESNSVWFPTIDAPNEKMTQEIFITVQDPFKSLSNGTLVYSNDNSDGTHTDYWKMDKPHPPYLAMLAAGDFEVFKDEYHKSSGETIPVDYYLEKEYAPYAEAIFGNTPEMLSFYSGLLGVEYPWDKYSQIVVRDYVSGAMENTTAVIHGEFLHQTERELQDDNNEAVIAHELFHHWFGDLVTCESWGQLPLNESFATYGEYLWDEYKYGADDADWNQYLSTLGYFREAQSKKVPLIRFDYTTPDDMFDAHSYNKGGHVLHMLRKLLGDDAYFQGLQKYLKTNAFKHAEVGQLRLAMEEVSGLDLAWFFDQWFFQAGHPVLEINYFVDGDDVQVQVRQLQTDKGEAFFQLPIRVDLHSSNTSVTEEVMMTESEQLFEFSMTNLDWVSVDPEGVLLCEKKDLKPEGWWLKQLEHQGPVLERLQPLIFYSQIEKADPKIIELAAKDSFGEIQSIATDLIYLAGDSLDFTEPLKRIITNPQSTHALSDAIETMALFNYEPVWLKSKINELMAVEDQSYVVLASCLIGLIDVNPVVAEAKAKELKDVDNLDLQISISEVLLATNTAEGEKHIRKQIEKTDGFDQYDYLAIYTSWLESLNVSQRLTRLDYLEQQARNAKVWWVRYEAIYAINEIRKALADSADEGGIKKAKEIENLLMDIRNKETSPDLLQYFPN